MIDIDVEGRRRYGVIENGSRAHKALLKLRTALITARLSSEDGGTAFVGVDVVRTIMAIKPGALDAEITHLVHIGVLNPIYGANPNCPYVPEFFGDVHYDDSRWRPYFKFNSNGGHWSHMGPKGFCLGPQALAALNDLRAGEEIVRFPFP